MKILRILAALVIAVVASQPAPQAAAQDYPTRPVRIVVPFPERGVVDIIARAVGQKLSGIWDRPVVVENHRGGDGAIGVGVAAKSAADGSTLLIHSYLFAVSPALFTNWPYDPIKDFVGIAPLVHNPEVLVVGPSAGVRTIAELIAAAKASPGQLKFGAHPLSTSHLSAEKFKLASGIDVAHVSSKGMREAIDETVVGRATFSLFSMPVLLPRIREGKLLPLAVGSARRSTDLPEVPTMAEAGIPGFDFTSWYGMWAPAGTPADIVDKLANDVAHALAARELREQFSKWRFEPMTMGRAEFAHFVRNEVEDFARTVKAAGIQRR